MSDREAVTSVATEIIMWQSAAQQVPLPELRAIVTDWQGTLAASLDAFNAIYADHAEHDGCGELIKQAISHVAETATAIAIFILGVSQRTHKAAQQN